MYLTTSQMSHDEIKRLNNKLIRTYLLPATSPNTTDRNRAQDKKNASKNSAIPTASNPNPNPT